MSKQIKLALVGLTSSGKSHELFELVKLLEPKLEKNDKNFWNKILKLFSSSKTDDKKKYLIDILKFFKDSRIQKTTTDKTKLQDVYSGRIKGKYGKKIELYVFDLPGETFDSEKMEICMAIIDALEDIYDIKTHTQEDVKKYVTTNWDTIKEKDNRLSPDGVKSNFGEELYKYLYPLYYIKNEATDITFCHQIDSNFRETPTNNLFTQIEDLISNKNKKCRLSIRAIDTILDKTVLKDTFTNLKARQPQNAIQDLCSIVSLCILAKVYDKENFILDKENKAIPLWVTDVKDEEYISLIRAAINLIMDNIKLDKEKKWEIKSLIKKFNDSQLDSSTYLGGEGGLCVPRGVYFSSSCVNSEGEIKKPDEIGDKLSFSQMPFGTLALANDLFEGKIPLLENSKEAVKTGAYFNNISISDLKS